MRNEKIFSKESTMTLEEVLYAAKAHITGDRKNGAAAPTMAVSTLGCRLPLCHRF